MQRLSQGALVGFIITSLILAGLMRTVGEELWILLDTPPDGSGVVVVVGSDGSTRRIEVAAAGSATTMAVDEARGRMFLYTSDDAQLLEAELPRGPEHASGPDGGRR